MSGEKAGPKLEDVLLNHMRFTCKELGLAIIWRKLVACNWVDGELNKKELLGSFKFMRGNTPEHPHYEIWVHEPAAVAPAVSALRLFGYEFEADWLVRRSNFARSKLVEQGDITIPKGDIATIQIKAMSVNYDAISKLFRVIKP